MDQGYRLTDVSGWWDDGQRFAAIWDTSQGPAWEARHGLPLADYQATFDALAANGLRPVRLSSETPRRTARMSQGSGTADPPRSGPPTTG